MISKKTRSNIVQGSWIRKLFEKGNELRKQGIEVIDLSLGNPVLEPPERVIESIKENAGIKGIHRYMSNAGFEETRQKIAEYLNQKNLLKTSKEKIVLTCGAGGAINVILKTILNPMDEVIIFTPCFMEYKFYIENFEGKAVECSTKEDYSIDFSELGKKISEKTKAVIINSPNNPTGKVYSKKELMKLSDFLKEKEKEFNKEIYVISDEPYRDVLFDGIEFTSISSIYPAHSFMVFSWSKSLGLAGERIGYIACPKQMPKEVIDGLVLNNRILGFVNAPALMQKIAGENLEPIKGLDKIYENKRNYLIKELAKSGYGFFVPQGAFYLFVKSPLENDIEFCLNAAEKHLLVSPGTGFGKKGFFRIAFCTEDETLKKAIDLLKELKQSRCLA
ncbi:MAG: pyridoxal phosphate-dependent aminotransferase [Candidatus Diapherotrites archaeon]